MKPLSLPQANALLQIIILALLVAGIGLRQRRKHFSHGVTMLAAVALNMISFALIMLPSLLQTAIISSQPLHPISIVSITHSAIGLVVMLLGIWLVASWHLRSSLTVCFKNKKLMRITAALWLAALLAGFVLYYLLYMY